MLNKTYMFKAISTKPTITFLQIDPKDEEKIEDNSILINLDSFGGFSIYRNESKTFEKVMKIKREDNSITSKKNEIAHKKHKEVNKTLIDKYFPDCNFPFAREEEVCKNYYLEYDRALIEKCFNRGWSITETMSCEDSITMETEKSGTITINPENIEFTERCGFKLDKYIVMVKNDILDIIEFDKSKECDSGNLVTLYESTLLSLNMKTGLCYLHPKKRGGVVRGEMKNVTTGNCPAFFDFPDVITDKVIEVIKEYNKEKFGIEFDCVKLKNNVDTIRSFNFNPSCNLLYYYKSFFNTRFRNYFKRDDLSANNFEALCTMINVPYSKNYIELCAANPEDLFMAKCLYDAGINNPENIVSMLKVIRENCWNKYEMYDFIDKYYGENTDYLYRKIDNYCSSNVREDLCKYISKSIPYTSEDEFVTMFVRSFVQHNKYWKRSLHQVATLIDLEDYGRELMRKACSYGLNKIQSDNIDLAYDKVITKNKFIKYSTDELAYEVADGDILFKLPIDMQETSDLSSDLIDEKIAKNIAFEAARKFYDVIFVKDSHGEILAYLKFRNNMLLEAKINNSSTSYNKDQIKKACLNWCDSNDIKRYRCNDLKDDNTSWLPF